MTYTTNQISRAKTAYNRFMQIETLSNYDVKTIGVNEAENRLQFHNNIVSSINEGDKGLEREWKLFFLTEEVKADQKKNDSKDKKPQIRQRVLMS